MSKKQILLFLLLITPVFSSDVSFFVDENQELTTEQQATIEFMQNYNIDYKIINDIELNNLNKILWVHSSERNKPHFLINSLKKENETLIEYMNSGGKILLTHNAIELIDYLGLENNKVTEEVYWNPWDDDKIYTVFEKNTDFLEFKKEDSIKLYNQKRGKDNSIYFIDREFFKNGIIISHEKRFWGGEYHYYDQPIFVKYNNIILLRRIRLSPSYSPTTDQKDLLNQTISHLIKQSSFEKPESEKMIEILDIFKEEGKLKTKFNVFENTSGNIDYIEDLDNLDFTLNLLENEKIIEKEIPYYWNTMLNGTYILEIDEPKLVGNFFVQVCVNDYDICNKSNFTLTTRHRKHLLFISDKNFWNTLFLSVTENPVLIYDKNNMYSLEKIDNFIDNYNPNEIFSTSIKKGGYKITKEGFKEQFQGNGLISIDDSKTKSIWASAIAQKQDMRLTTENIGDICTYNCNENSEILDTETELRNKYIEILKSRNEKTDYLILVNTNNNLSSLTSQLIEKRNGFPVMIDIDDQKTTKEIIDTTQKELNETLILLDENNLIEDYEWSKNIYLTLLGMPYIKIDDPADEMLNNEDGDEIFTDSLYGDINDDGYQDFSVGRITDPIQIANIDLWENDNKKILIPGSYRSISYFDLLTNGMDEAFITEHFFKNNDFKTKRLVEERLTEFLTINKDKAVEEAITIREMEHLMIQEVLRKIGISNYINWAVETKYILLETDWERFFKYGRIGSLEELTKENFLKYFNRHGTAWDYNILFYFGVGDENKLLLPNKQSSILNPYEESDQTIYANDLELHDPKIMMLEHDLSGTKNSHFVDKNNFILIGETGVIHQANTAQYFVVFLDSIISNNTIGESMKNMKNSFIWGNNKNASKDLITFGSCEEAMENSLKEYYTRILYGDPKIKIDPNNIDFENKSYYKTKNQEIVLNKKINYVIENSTVIFDKPDQYLLNPNKPIIPIIQEKIHLPTNSKINNVNYSLNRKYVDLDSIIYSNKKYYDKENFTGTYPENLIHIDKMNYIDGRKDLIVTILPVKYNSSGEDVIIDEINLSINYSAPMEISDFKYNGNFIIETKSNKPFNLSIKIENKYGTEFINRTYQTDGLITIDKNINQRSKASVIMFNKNNIAGPYSIMIGKQKEDHDMPYKIIEEETPFNKTTHFSNAIEDIEYFIGNNTVKIKYKNYDFIMFIENSNRTFNYTLIEPEFKFVFIDSPLKSVKELFSPKGKIRILEMNGTTKEDFYGNHQELKEKINNVSVLFQERKKFVEQKIQSLNS